MLRIFAMTALISLATTYAQLQDTKFIFADPATTTGKKYTAIVFDLGGVVLDDKQIPAIAEKLYPGRGTAIAKAFYRNPDWRALDEGSIDIPTFASSVEQKFGHDAAIVCSIIINMLPHLPLMPRGIEILHVAKAQGYKVYALSNIYDEALKVLPAQHKFFKLFDGFIASCEVGLVKPEKAIYEKLLQQFNLKPQETLFIDDREDNILGAVACGIDGIVCNDTEETLTLLRKHKILTQKSAPQPPTDTRLIQAANSKPAALKKYTTLVLDLGGVLVNWQPEITIANLLPNTPASAAIGALFHDPCWADFDKGLIDIPVLAKLAHNKYFFDEQLTRQALELIGPNLPLIKPCIDIMKQAKAQGYKLYVLSNHPKPYIEDYLRTHQEVFSLFDGLMVSYETAHLKPDVEIYQDLFKKFNLNPDECLFIDDVPANIVAGAALGMDGIVCTDHKEVLHILHQHHILKASSN